jgi:predicted dithiol-disulfide oxidoreductase (DUF899 family)
MGTFGLFDVAPLGRNEEVSSEWWQRHDESRS